MLADCAQEGNPFPQCDQLYRIRMASETLTYQNVEDINILPPIFHYWSNTYLRPMCEEFGFSNPDQFFAKYLVESAAAVGDIDPIFLSVGAGNCDTEVRVAKLMNSAGLGRFKIRVLRHESTLMLDRGRQMAERENVAEHLSFTVGDFNKWRGRRRYAGVMANQSLHHVLLTWNIFSTRSKRSLHAHAYFVTSDMIGRNGHRRWPEALERVHEYWQELPSDYRYNRQLRRHEESFQDWDCSVEGFEGIRAQDVLPLLLERFNFRLFIGFANVVDIFIDRSFGHNFSVEQEWDLAFVDRLHATDERGLAAGTLTPTHMMAVMTPEATTPCVSSRGLTPERSVRFA